MFITYTTCKVYMLWVKIYYDGTKFFGEMSNTMYGKNFTVTIIIKYWEADYAKIKKKIRPVADGGIYCRNIF